VFSRSVRGPRWLPGGRCWCATPTPSPRPSGSGDTWGATPASTLTVLGHGDVYLLTDHEGVPFVQDGTRDGEHLRAAMTAEFAVALARHNKPWAMLTGSLEQRLDLAERIANATVSRRLTFTDPI